MSGGRVGTGGGCLGGDGRAGCLFTEAMMLDFGGVGGAMVAATPKGRLK